MDARRGDRLIMALLTATAVSPRVQSRMNLARLLEMPERDFEEKILEIEATEHFRLLKESGALVLHPYPRARAAARRYAGRELRASSSALPEVLDGRGDLARLLERVGQERFEECFLQDNPLTDDDRRRVCGISQEDVRKLRELVDRLYVQSEFDDSSSRPAPVEISSVVAGIQIENDRAVIAFFHREIWKGRYEIDARKQAELIASVPPRQAREIERLLFKLEFLERRKSTLYRTLEALIESQADYLVSRDPERRRPLTQRAVAASLRIAPSVLNTLVSNKAIQLPWGLEAPLKILMPSAKSLLLGRLYDIAMENHALSDVGLGRELKRLHGAQLSRRSIAQYRSELSLGGNGSRTMVQAAIG